VASRTLLEVSDPRAPIAIGSPFAKSHAVNAVHPSSGLIATAYSRNSLTTPGAVLSLWQATKDGVTETWSRPGEIGRRSDGTMHLDFDAGGKRLLRTTPPPQGHLIIHDVRTGEVLLDIEHDAYKAIFAGSPERIIAISSELQDDNTHKGNIALLDPQDGRVLASLDHDSASTRSPPHPTAVSSPSAGAITSFRILDADTLAVKYRFRAHDQTISALCFHPTQPILASGAADHSIKLWNYDDATLLQTRFQPKRPPACNGWAGSCRPHFYGGLNPRLRPKKRLPAPPSNRTWVWPLILNTFVQVEKNPSHNAKLVAIGGRRQFVRVLGVWATQGDIVKSVVVPGAF
jgi:WD40 repeat protein